MNKWIAIWMIWLAMLVSIGFGVWWRSAERALREPPQAPQLDEDYTQEWQTDSPVPRLTEETTRVRQAVAQHLGIDTGYRADTWIERRCQMVVAHLQPLEQETEYWVLWDAKANTVIELLNREQVIELLHGELGDLSVWGRQWDYWQDAPGQRPRYLVGYIGLESAYLHLNTRNCSLQPLQVQLARGRESMGKFISLPVIDATR